ncbi:MAG: SpoIID/LytB domain-containing protein [Eubacteriales bacterium]|nr:SpoIID/LytB domain-containing protein [Eubacteriales bacterium]
MDEDWVKRLLTIVIGSIVLFTVFICQTGQIEKNLIKKTAGQKTERQIVQKEQTEKKIRETEESVEGQPISIKGEEENPTIRVLIKSASYAGEYHQKVSICGDRGFLVSYDGKEEEYNPEDILEIERGTYETTGKIKIVPKEDGKICILNLERNQERPMYRGSFEITRHPEGLRVINVVKMEDYLCGVVPSEMPASYPLEALKAQAVCARSYVKKSMENSIAEYDVDDSTSYQVYNNFPENENSTKAVEETRGEVMMKDNTILDAQYYSTSCGVNRSQDLSEEPVFETFLNQTSHTAYESEEPWYRWKAEVSLEQLRESVLQQWNTDVGEVSGVYVTEREKNGRAKTLIISGSFQELTIEGEYNIRMVLSPKFFPVINQEESGAVGMNLLPSGFFYLEPRREEYALQGYTIYGGGYGHGIGMSQNGAKQMALNDMGYREILSYFYGDMEIIK